MKTPLLQLFIIAASITLASAQPAWTIRLTVEDKNSSDKAVIYEVPHTTGDNISFPVNVQGKFSVFTLAFSTNEEKEKVINCSLQNTSIVIPGSATSPGYTQYILNAWFPYSTKEFKIFTTNTLTLSVLVSEDKK